MQQLEVPHQGVVTVTQERNRIYLDGGDYALSPRRSSSGDSQSVFFVRRRGIADAVEVDAADREVVVLEDPGDALFISSNRTAWHVGVFSEVDHGSRSFYVRGFSRSSDQSNIWTVNGPPFGFSPVEISHSDGCFVSVYNHESRHAFPFLLDPADNSVVFVSHTDTQNASVKYVNVRNEWVSQNVPSGQIRMNEIAPYIDGIIASNPTIIGQMEQRVVDRGEYSVAPFIHRRVDYIEALELSDERFVGIPKFPVVSVPKLDVVGAAARRYESRTYCNGGVVVVSRQRAAEVVVNSLLRPEATVVEVGEYAEGDYDLINRIHTNDGDVRVNGRFVPGVTDKVAFLGDLIRRKGAGIIATHEQDLRLVDLATSWGIVYPENFFVFKDFSCKSGLNRGISQFNATRPESVVKPFGVEFRDIHSLWAEVERLSQFGEGAYIKFDFAPEGQVNAGGEGQVALHREMPLDEKYAKLVRFVQEGRYSESTLQGVVQLMIPSPDVLSVSSGQDHTGRYRMYEAHYQLQDGSTAAGAIPLSDSTHSRFLLHDLWSDMARFFAYHAITGRQNMNYLCIPDHMLDKVKVIYGDPSMAPVVPIDLNYRSISGTLNAMARYEEETGIAMNFDNFCSNGIKVDPFYAANPHLIYEAARYFGLRPGRGGNFSVINMGTFEPGELAHKSYFKTQVLINNTFDPQRQLGMLGQVLAEAPNPSQLRQFASEGFAHITPDQAAALSEHMYAEFLYTNLYRSLRRQ